MLKFKGEFLAVTGFSLLFISNKGGRICWISDFCRLNKVLNRAYYFLPNIPFINQKRAGFSFITKLDISISFHTFGLDEQTQQYYIISAPFRHYQYLHLHMGLTNSPDVFLSDMHPLFQDISKVDNFIDNRFSLSEDILIGT